VLCFFFFSCRKSVFNRCVDQTSPQSTGTANESAAEVTLNEIDEERCDRDIMMASHSLLPPKGDYICFQLRRR